MPLGDFTRGCGATINLKTETKISVYRAVVLTTLIYGSESWVLYRCHIRLLERLHQRCLRTILKIHWSDYVTNTEVLEKAKITSIEATLLKTQLGWAGHVFRMADHRLPKIVLSSGCRNRGAHRKRYKDMLKKALKVCNINPHQWTTQAADRNAWRHTIRQATSAFKASRRASLEEKRARRKNSVRAESSTNQTFPCSHCGLICRSRIGCISHLRACTRCGQN